MRIGRLVVLFSLLAAPALAAQAKPAATAAFPAGERAKLARAWLEAYNAGDEAAYRKYMETNAETGGTPIDARVERFHQMRENLGNLTVIEAKEVADGIELKVKTDKGEEGVITVMLSAQAPFRFQAVKVEL